MTMRKLLNTTLEQILTLKILVYQYFFETRKD